jgi:biotin operon repressor
VNTHTSKSLGVARQATDKFTRDQFDWLRQVAFDSGLQHAASGVAIGLTKYFNRKHDGWAWMSQATLASDLGISESTVRRALSALVERGHLISKRRGKEETNLYHLALKSDIGDRSEMTDHDQSEMTDHTDGVTGQFCTSDRSKHVKVTGQNCTPNPLNEPSEEPSEGAASKKPKENRLSGPRRRQQTLFPDGFHLDDDLADHAAKKAGWDHGRAFAEFERFQNYHQSKGNKFAGWRAHGAPG